MGYFLSSSAQFVNKMLIDWLFSLAELKQLRDKYEVRICTFEFEREVCVAYQMFSNGVDTNKEYKFYIPKEEFKTITADDTIDNFTIKLWHITNGKIFNLARKPLGEHFLERL